jgi:hypothetical protein
MESGILSSYLNPWTIGGKPFEAITSDVVSFVYIITNLETGKKYIGKKGFYSVKTKQVNGKKKKLQVESDWRLYYGSNDTLKKDIGKIGSLKFKREILRLCKTKGEASYYEAKFQFDTNALISEEYYNEWLMLRVHKKHLKMLTLPAKNVIVTEINDTEKE